MIEQSRSKKRLNGGERHKRRSGVVEVLGTWKQEEEPNEFDPNRKTEISQERKCRRSRMGKTIGKRQQIKTK